MESMYRAGIADRDSSCGGVRRDTTESHENRHLAEAQGSGAAAWGRATSSLCPVGYYSASHKPRIQAARNSGVGCAFDDGPAVGEQRHLIGLAPELEHEFVVPHYAVCFQPLLHLKK